ncbi:MAG: prepilin-type N-terminal cleavage/methylation domain-containing protein [Patescibacteria group bacterium]|nr:prepilin-type N-terminal cleavage/methylation domain-containing protein [Patescibacteria group bacterium]
MNNRDRKIKIHKQYKGFTLMEVLVAMSIFIIVALASLTVYAAILKASQKTTAYTRIQQEAQLIMGVLAKKIRTSRVNYQYYADKYDIALKTENIYNDVINDDGEKELALVDAAGTNYLFATSTDSLTVSSKASGEDDYGEAVAIPSQLVEIRDLIFIIQPLSYPFDINLPPVSQPRVTIVITFASSKGAQTASFTVEETVPQRSGGVVE